MKKGPKRLSRVMVARILKEGTRVVYNKLGTAKYTQGDYGLTVITGNTQQKKATLRNQLRRRVRAAFRHDYLSSTILLYTSKQAYAMTFNEIKYYVTDLMEKIKKDSQYT